MAHFRKQAASRRCGHILLAAALVLCCAAAARAEAISYSLMMCEDLAVLKNPTNKTLAMNEAWKPQHTLMLERTMPYFELRNTSDDPEAVITQVSMTIGNAAKNFDWSKLVEATPGVAFSLITPDAVVGGAKSDTLVIKFAGLAPGDYVRFQVGLSPDDPSNGMIQDYRMVLFTLNGNDEGSNSTVTVDFDNSQDTASLVKQLPDFSSMGMSSFTSLAFPDHYMDVVMPFTLSDGGTIPTSDGTPPDGTPPDETPPDETPQVPEPASIALLAAGMLGLSGWRLLGRRKRGRGIRGQRQA
jgi:PEP-CTERM motif